MLTSFFHRFLVPTCLHFRSKNPPKSLQKSILEGISFLIDFCIDFISVFARFGRPTWRHSGRFFFQNGGTLWRAPLFFLGSMFFFGFLAVPTSIARKMSRAVLGLGRFWASILEVFGIHFGGFWLRFGCHVACNLNIFKAVFF